MQERRSAERDHESYSALERRLGTTAFRDVFESESERASDGAIAPRRVLLRVPGRMFFPSRIQLAV